MKIKLLPKYLILSTVIGLCLVGCKAKQKMVKTDDKQETTEQTTEDTTTKTEETSDNSSSDSDAPKTYSPTTLEGKINEYFAAIANAPTTDAANAKITEAMSSFSNPNVPVLIIFYKSDGKESYDEPTTIIKYLNYLKDTKNNKATVEEIVKDSNGRVKEIVLRK